MTGKRRTDPDPTDTPPVSTPVEDVPTPAEPDPVTVEPEPGPKFLDEGRLDEVLDTPPPGSGERVAFPVFGRGLPLPEVDPSSYGPDSTPLDDLRDDRPLSAAEALAEVLRRVRPIAKAREAEPKAGGYAFRGIDDVYEALHDLFAEVGLVMLPSTIDREREQRPRASGSGHNYVTHVHVRLRFLAADGSSEELDGWGEGADTGDKSTGKAYSQMIKSALLAAFLIPTGESAANDPDRTNSEESRSFSPQEVERASTALGAAREATTFDALVNVRRRAESLLAVPITSDGVLAPLGLHLDNLRTRLESRVPEAQS